MKLTKSQRDRENPQYASFVRAVGEGTHPTTKLPDGTDLIALHNYNDSDPTNHFQLQCTTDFDDLINFVYIPRSNRGLTFVEQPRHISHNKQRYLPF